MSALILDAGALIAVDHGDPKLLAQIEEAGQSGDPVRTNALAIAQVWRDGKGWQARLARALRGIEWNRSHAKTRCGPASFSGRPG